MGNILMAILQLWLIGYDGGRKQVKSFATTIHHLKLRSSVLDLISDYQLSWEEYNHSKG
jgi:hypothetical protein